MIGKLLLFYDQFIALLKLFGLGYSCLFALKCTNLPLPADEITIRQRQIHHCLTVKSPCMN